MKRYLAVRVTQSLVIIFLVSVITFFMMHLVPGDPIHLMIGHGHITEEEIQSIRAHWGLDRPGYVQFGTWFGNMLQGNLGRSVIYRGVPVGSLIRDAAGVTIALNLMAIAVSVGVAVPGGIIAALRRYSVFDYAVMTGATLGIALPNFWVGLMLIILFGVRLGWLPPFGLETWHGWILPVAVLATEHMALLARMMRSSTTEVLTADYVRTARAKGLSERVVVYRHVLRNALLPVVTVLGYRVAWILSGTIVVETIFALPGAGRLFMSSVLRLDYQVIQAIVLLGSMLVVAGNLLTDLVYGLIDPRIRFG